MSISVSKAVPLIIRTLKHKLVPMLHGSPGIGKSDIIRQIAAQARLKVIDVRLSSCDPTDLNGLAWFNRDAEGNATAASYVPFDIFPVEGTPLPHDEEGKELRGWILFMDELPSAPHAVQAPAFKLILDRMIGQRKLHEKVCVVAAGNTEDDGAIVNALPTPLQSRMVNLKLTPNRKEWMQWALANGLDFRINAYLEFKPENFYKFDANHTDMTFACPRTWMFASKILNNENQVDDSIEPLISGCVSEAIGRDFMQFVKIFESTPKIADIERDPMTAKCPTDNLSIMWAMTGVLGHAANKNNLSKLVTYMERMPTEFQVVAFRNIFARNSDLANEACVDKWVEDHYSEMWD